MNWKKFTPYWVYLGSMLLIEMLLWFVAPILILLLLKIYPVVILCMALIVALVGVALQHNLNLSTHAKRVLISAVCSLVVALIMPTCVTLRVWSGINFSYFLDKSVWIFFGVHLVVMYLSMEIYALKCKNKAAEDEKKPIQVNRLAVACCAIIVGVVGITAGVFGYKLKYEKTKVVETASRDALYTLVVNQVGEPQFPFGPTNCQVVLKKDNRTVQKYRFMVFNDGGNVSENNFVVQWTDDNVHLTVSGEEQVDTIITIPYEGETFSKRVIETSHVADIPMPPESSVTPEVPGASDALVMEETETAETPEIYAGYRRIYEQFYEKDGYTFTPSYSAKGNSRYILREDENEVIYLAYDRRSENNQCELFVCFRAVKSSDGTWSSTEAEILEIYAYELAGETITASGKKSWGDEGTENYRQVTGE